MVEDDEKARLVAQELDEHDMKAALERLAEITSPSSRTGPTALKRLDRVLTELNLDSIEQLSGRAARTLVWLINWEDSTMDGLVALLEAARARQ